MKNAGCSSPWISKEQSIVSRPELVHTRLSAPEPFEAGLTFVWGRGGSLGLHLCGACIKVQARDCLRSLRVRTDSHTSMAASHSCGRCSSDVC